ncbi:MAG TPA: hypothetical protein VN737_04725 [Bryobacteraceae bacterium]|jgi:hypothetical protein|nr:hypothetical protein [Bryobacteraceae bacterium]
MNNTILGATPTKPDDFERIKAEIVMALDELQERGVICRIEETQGKGGLSLNFAKGATSQTIRFAPGEWTKPDAVKSTVIERLEL